MKKKIIRKAKEKIPLVIVKRKGHSEAYDERKVYGSCYFACKNAHMHDLQAEQICNKVCIAVTAWISKQKVVSSHDIFKKVIEELRRHDEDAAFLFETHRDIS